MLDLDDIGTYRIKDEDIYNSIDFLFQTTLQQQSSQIK